MIFILGFKDHLGAVWIGMGLHILFTRKGNYLGVLLTIAGITWTYLVLFQIMPYFREGLDAWNGINSIDPFNEVWNKLKYLILLFFPFGFVHIFFLKHSILAAPAIGIWIISFGGLMVTTKYHYDDIPSVLLFISFILICKDLNISFIKKVQFTKLKQTLSIIFIILIFSFLPHNSPLRVLYNEIPKVDYSPYHKEINEFTIHSRNDRVALANVIGPHVQKLQKELISQDNYGNCMKRSPYLLNEKEKPKYWVFARNINDTQIWDMNKCVEQYEKNPNYVRVKIFKFIDVFKSNHDY